MKRFLCLILAFAILFFIGRHVLNRPAKAESPQPAFQSYKDIPGVTQEHISALEKLLADKPRLVYGVIVSAEAFQQEDGSIGGFAALFARRLTELFGFEIVFSPCSWEKLNEKIILKEIDLSGDFTATPERLQKFFMTDAIVQRTFKIFTDRNANDLQITAKNRPIRCGFLEGGSTFPIVDVSWKLPFEPVFVADQSLVPAMLLNGQIDAFVEEGVIEAAFDAYDFIKTEEFYPLAYSTVSLTTGNSDLEPLIDVVQKYIKNGGYYELTEFQNQGYKEYLKNKLFGQLTSEEKEYIQKHKDSETPILAACEVDNYPTSFYNVKEKSFQGMALDALNKISELTGLTFQVGNKPDTLWPELIEGLENGKYSICSELLRSRQREGRFLWADQSYCKNHYALLSKAEYPDVNINQIFFAKVGLMKDSGHADVFLEWFPGSASSAKYYKGTGEAFEALAKGDVELLMASQNTLLNLTNYQEKPGFKANFVFNYSSDSFFGFNKDEKILASIVNKALRYANTEEITAHWQRKVFDYQSKMLRDMMPFTITFVMVLLVGLFVIFVLLVKNKKINKNLEKLVAKRTSELERQTSELAFQTSMLATIFESIPDLVFCKDVNGIYTRCNPSLERFLGMPEAEVVGKTDIEIFNIDEEMAKHFIEADRKVLCLQDVERIEEVVTCPNGVQRTMETVKVPLIQNDKVIGMMGISRDITKRKEAEEILKLTLDNLDASVYITEIETGEILFINNKMIQEYGDADCIGKKCWEVLQKGFTEPCDFCPIPKLLENGGEDCVWEEHSTLTGKYYKNTDSIIKWYDGRLVHMQHSVDITSLINLQKDLENASRAKGDFLSRMSHEIRTPLNAIIGMVNIAMNVANNEKTKDCLVKADNASKHLLGVINDILDMAKIEADKFELDCREFSVEKNLMNVVNVTNFRAEQKKQNFIVNLNENVPESIVGDDLRLSQVITNLLTNAVKFTPERGTIILTIDKIEDNNDEVTLRVEVEDNGIGISQEQQERLFTSFEQADSGIARKFGGTGLGLAISKRIVEMMGGKIWIESDLGKGTKFIFTMKAGKGKEKTRTKLSEKINKDDMRLLAVDDSPEIREYFKHVMDSLGLPCDVASNGAEALDMVAACEGKPYTIFFIDWQMPGMNGIELTKKIKEIVLDNAVVFMISVADWSTIEKEALAVGVRSFIAKPLFPSTLVNALNGCIEITHHKAEAGENFLFNKKQRRFDIHTILIAEDVEINREIMSAVLEDTGVNIDYAENGAMAVSMFEANPDKYSLVLMDIHMPEVDGYEATRKIRALELQRAKDIPIIAMTANVFREDIENCLAVGMNGHIGKPVDQDDLFAKLEQYLL